MDYDKCKYILNDSEYPAINRNFRYGFNRIRFHNRFETLEHFMSKSLIGFLIFKQGDGLISEFDLKTAETADILQVRKNKELIFYEIESEGDKEKSFSHIGNDKR